MSYGASTTPVKVDRLKLIEKLKERVKEKEARLASNFAPALKLQIEDSERGIETMKKNLSDAIDRLARLKKIKTSKDLMTDKFSFKERWAEPWRNDPAETDLRRTIRALELSEEKAITVKADSDLYSYL